MYEKRYNFSVETYILHTINFTYNFRDEKVNYIFLDKEKDYFAVAMGTKYRPYPFVDLKLFQNLIGLNLIF